MGYGFLFFYLLLHMNNLHFFFIKLPLPWPMRTHPIFSPLFCCKGEWWSSLAGTWCQAKVNPLHSINLDSITWVVLCSTYAAKITLAQGIWKGQSKPAEWSKRSKVWSETGGHARQPLVWHFHLKHRLEGFCLSVWISVSTCTGISITFQG